MHRSASSMSNPSNVIAFSVIVLRLLTVRCAVGEVAPSGTATRAEGGETGLRTVQRRAVIDADARTEVLQSTTENQLGETDREETSDDGSPHRRDDTSEQKPIRKHHLRRDDQQIPTRRQAPTRAPKVAPSVVDATGKTHPLSSGVNRTLSVESTLVEDLAVVKGRDNVRDWDNSKNLPCALMAQKNLECKKAEVESEGMPKGDYDAVHFREFGQMKGENNNEPLESVKYTESKSGTDGFKCIPIEQLWWDDDHLIEENTPTLDSVKANYMNQPWKYWFYTDSGSWAVTIWGGKVDYEIWRYPHGGTNNKVPQMLAVRHWRDGDEHGVQLQFVYDCHPKAAVEEAPDEASESTGVAESSFLNFRAIVLYLFLVFVLCLGGAWVWVIKTSEDGE
ncbi:unnamed protein product [Amoebophrya sp. A25]|nr:unnamed protein product [Amoebophrya sp. A25]|eukprot:GSA25T00002332001.1